MLCTCLGLQALWRAWLLCRPKNWVWPGVHSIQQILEKVIKLLVFLVNFLEFFGLEIDNMQKFYKCIMNQWPNDWIEMININPFLNKLILQISLIWFDKANPKQSKYLQINLNLPATLRQTLVPVCFIKALELNDDSSIGQSLVHTVRFHDCGAIYQTLLTWPYGFYKVDQTTAIFVLLASSLPMER